MSALKVVGKRAVFGYAYELVGEPNPWPAEVLTSRINWKCRQQAMNAISMGHYLSLSAEVAVESRQELARERTQESQP